MAKNTVSEVDDNLNDVTALPALPPVTSKDDGFKGAESDEGETSTEDKERHRGAVSSSGDVWDPSMHTYPPHETKGGAWRKIGGRGARGKGKATEGEYIAPNADYRQAATHTAQAYGMLNHLIMGTGAEVHKQELVPMIDAWENHYQEHGIRNMPTWLQVVFTSGSYSYGVATRPPVKKRVGQWLMKVGFALRILKPKKEDNTDAHANSGNNE